MRCFLIGATIEGYRYRLSILFLDVVNKLTSRITQLGSVVFCQHWRGILIHER